MVSISSFCLEHAYEAQQGPQRANWYEALPQAEASSLGSCAHQSCAELKRWQESMLHGLAATGPKSGTALWHDRDQILTVILDYGGGYTASVSSGVEQPAEMSVVVFKHAEMLLADVFSAEDTVDALTKMSLRIRASR